MPDRGFRGPDNPAARPGRPILGALLTLMDAHVPSDPANPYKPWSRDARNPGPSVARLPRHANDVTNPNHPTGITNP